MAVTSEAGAESTSARFWTSSVISCSIGTPVKWAGTVIRLFAKSVLVKIDQMSPPKHANEAAAVTSLAVPVPVSTMFTVNPLTVLLVTNP